MLVTKMKLVHLATVLMPAGMAMAAARRETVNGTVSSTATPTATQAPSHFQLKTQVKPRESAKDAFDNLYVYPYYTAPDVYDAALTFKKSRAPTAHANYGPIGGVSGPPYFDVIFNMTSKTTDRSFQLSPKDDINYAAHWEPVGIDTGLGSPNSGSAFFLQGDTLQWTDEAGFFRPASFYGWLGEFPRQVVRWARGGGPRS